MLLSVKVVIHTLNAKGPSLLCKAKVDEIIIFTVRIDANAHLAITIVYQVLVNYYWIRFASA